MADINVTNLLDLSSENDQRMKITVMKKKHLVNPTKNLKEKVSVDTTVKKLCNKISQLSTSVNNITTENEKLSSQLMVASNISILLVTRATESEK